MSTQTQKSLLWYGKIPPKTECPFQVNCSTKAEDRCTHQGTEHQIAYSCAIARAFDLVNKEAGTSDPKYQAALDAEWLRTSRLAQAGMASPMSPRFKQWFKAGYDAGKNACMETSEVTSST